MSCLSDLVGRWHISKFGWPTTIFGLASCYSLYLGVDRWGDVSHCITCVRLMAQMK